MVITRTDIQVYAEIFEPDEKIWKLVPGSGDAWHYYDSEPLVIPVLRGRGGAYGLPPLPVPRGMPDDVSPEVLQKYSIVKGGKRIPNPHYKDASWLSAEELSEYDWSAKAEQSGMVDKAGYITFRETGAPHQCWGQVQGLSVIVVSNRVMERRAQANEWRPTQKEAALLRRRETKIKNAIWNEMEFTEEKGADVAAELFTDEILDNSVDLHPEYYTKITFQQPLSEKCPNLMKAVHAIRNLGEARAVFWVSR